MVKDKNYIINGQIIHQKTKRGLVSLRVKDYDKDYFTKDSSSTDDEGRFTISFSSEIPPRSHDRTPNTRSPVAREVAETKQMRLIRICDRTTNKPIKNHRVRAKQFNDWTQEKEKRNQTTKI